MEKATEDDRYLSIAIEIIFKSRYRCIATARFRKLNMTLAYSRVKYKHLIG